MSRAGWWRARRARLRQLWVVGALAASAVTAGSAMGYFESLQVRARDLLMYLQNPRQPGAIVIVAVDDAAFDAFGRRQPVPRDYLARVLRGIRRAGANTVGLDISFRKAGPVAEDAALAGAIAEFTERGERRLVVASAALPDRGPLADPGLARLIVLSAPEVPVDGDAVVRRVVVRVGRTVAFGVALVESETIEPGTVLPINFIGPPGSFLTIPSDAVAAIGDAGADIAGDNPLRGRVVLVGGTFQDGRDLHMTPFGRMAGVEIHANVAQMLLTRSFVRPAGWIAVFGVQLVAVLVAGLVMTAMRPLWGTVVCLAAVAIVGIPASLAALRRGYLVDFLLPVLAVALLGLGADLLARRRLREALGRYVSPEVAARVERRPEELAGERREVSILFSDLRGFTTLSERMAPEKMAARLTEYFDAMTAAIFDHRGMVNDFVGDAIMAVFGAPLDDPDHARHAIESALAMQRALDGLNRRWQSEGLPPLRMGLGVHTGQVFAGNVGREGKVKYAVVGDTVNLASRVESLNKELGTIMLVTEAAYQRAACQVRATDRGLVHVKGRQEPVRVYEVAPPGHDETER
jgi:adenylate cyclase